MAIITQRIRINAPKDKVYEALTDFATVTSHFPAIHARAIIQGRNGRTPRPHPSWCIKGKVIAWDNISGYYEIGIGSAHAEANIEYVLFELETHEDVSIVILSMDYRMAGASLLARFLTRRLLHRHMKANLHAFKKSMENAETSVPEMTLA